MLKKFLFCIYFIVGFCYSQKGPGGVGETLGDDLHLWVKVDDLSLGTVSNWPDQSGNGRDLKQSVSVNQPSVTTSSDYNGYNIVNFDNSITAEEDYLVSSTFDSFLEDYDYTLYIIADGNQASASVADEATLFSMVGNQSNGAFNLWHLSASEKFRWTSPTSISHNNNSYDTDFFTPGVSIIKAKRYANNTFSTWHNNISHLSSESIGTTDYNLGRNYALAIDRAKMTARTLACDVAEVIHFDKDLNTTEEYLVENYLNAKYSVTISNDIYKREDYDHNVAGIGRISSSDLVESAQGTGIFKIYNPVGLGDDEFLIWGDDGTDLTTVIIGVGDLPSGINSRLSRVWSVSEADATGVTGVADITTVDIRLDLSFSSNVNNLTASDLVLLVDGSDTVFATGATEYSCVSYSGGIATFESVNLNDTDYFTIGSSNSFYSINDLSGEVELAGNTGPAGVAETDGSNMYLWLQADKGISGTTNVSNWEDQSGFLASIDPTKTTVFPTDVALPDGSQDERPDMGTADASNNFIAPIVFDGVNDNLVRNFTENATDDTYSIFLVWNTNSTPGGGSIFSSDSNVVNTGSFEISGNMSGGTATELELVNDGGTNHGIDTQLTTNIGDFSTKNITVVTRSNTNFITSYFNNYDSTGTVTTDVGTDNVNFFDWFALGMNRDRDEFVAADVYEVIILKNEVNSTQRLLIQNYLSAKYNVTISSGDIYKGDDSGYDYDVIGIGAVDLLNSDKEEDVKGNGIVRVYNASDLDDDEFLMLGHDNTSLTDANVINVPDTNNDSRVSRIWYVSQKDATGAGTPDVGTVTIEVDMSFSDNANIFTSSDLELWVNSSSDFSTVVTTVSCVSYSNGIATFTGVDLDDTDYFTIASNNILHPVSIIQGTSDLPGYLGPGGVGNTDGTSGILAWYMPGNSNNTFSTGSTVEDLIDLSGNGNDLDTEGEGTPDVTVPVSGWNGNSVLSFDDSSDESLGTNITSTTFANWSMFYVYGADESEVTENGLFSSRNTVSENNSFTIHSDGTDLFIKKDGVSSHALTINDAEGSATSPNLISLERKDTGTDTDTFITRLNGSNTNVTDYTNSLADTDYDNFQRLVLGVNRTNVATTTSEDHMNMNLGEFIIFNDAITDIQKSIVTNYIAAKYDLSLAGDDLYLGDDSGYFYDVIGIGDDADNKSHTDSQGTGIIRINNPRSLSDVDNTQEVLFIGANSKDYTFSTQGASGNYFEKLTAEWYVSETNDVGGVDLSINLSDIGLSSSDDQCLNNNLRIVVNGTSETLFTVSETGVAKIDNIDFSDGDVFRIEYRNTIVFDVNTSLYYYGGSYNTSDLSTTTAPSGDQSCYSFLATGTGNTIIANDLTIKSLSVADNSKLIVNDGISLTVSNAIDMNSSGEVRLLGDAMLNQTHTDVDVNTTADRLYKQVTSRVMDKYRYTYLSSPVNNAGTSYNLTSNLREGNTTVLSASTDGVSFSYVAGEDGDTSTTPHTLGLANLYVYENGIANDAWVALGVSDAVSIGDGFTLKTPGSIAENFVFKGTVNNGTYTKDLSTSVDAFSLIGNPYACYLDADEFISDNINTITGALYFYEQQEGTLSHEIGRYENGYGVYTLAGGVKASTSLDDTAGLGSGSYTAPERYIAPGQGFLILTDDDGGTLTFQNSQRATQTVGGSSVFFKQKELKTLSANDKKPFIRLGVEFNLTNDEVFHRQLGIAFTPNTSAAKFNKGFDAFLFDEQDKDAYIESAGNKLVISATQPIFSDLKVPITLNITGDERVNFTLDDKIDIDDTVFLYDNKENKVYNLQGVSIGIDVTKGDEKRFSLAFKEETNNDVLSLNGIIDSTLITEDYQIKIFDNEIKVISETLNIENLELYNITGQKIGNSLNSNTLLLPLQLEQVHILKIHSKEGEIVKKIVF